MIKPESVSFKKFFRKLQPCCFKKSGDEDEVDEEAILKDYFSKCFDDLLCRMQMKQQKYSANISKSIFSGFINLPLVISDRIFEAFKLEVEESELLSKTSFVDGMFNLFFNPSEKMEMLTFKIMDVDLKGEINQEDVNLLLTYMNIACDNVVGNSEEMVKNFFSPKNSLRYEEYINKIENENSNIFVLLLMFIYNMQPFTDQVIKFFDENRSKIKIKCETEKALVSNKCQLYIISPSKEVKLYIKYLCKYFVSPKRKVSSRNVSQYVVNEYEEMKNGESSAKDDKNNENNYSDNSDQKHSSPQSGSGSGGAVVSQDNSFSLSNQQTDDKTPSESSDSNSEKNKSSKHKYFESIVFELTNSKLIKELQKCKIVLVDNNLFSFNLIHSSDTPSVIDKVHPLSGCYFTACEEIIIQNVTFFPFAILSQYGNTMANMNNVFLSLSKKDLNECLLNLNTNMNIRIVDDHYDILNQLGCGVFGTVNLALDKITGDKVAIKMLNKSNITQEQFEMVKHEIDIMNFLKNCPNPNIVTPLDIFEDKHFIYYILEFMPGGTLKSYLKKMKMLSEDEVKKVIKQVTNALSFLDKMGIIHRDIKTENILLKKNDLDIVKLSDFGLSTVKFTNQKSNESCGTLLYSAPELVKRLFYDKKVDVWSLGILTYFLVTGNFPFQGFNITRNQMIKKICRDNLNFPDMNEVSLDCKNFIDDCLIKNPEERLSINNVLMSKFLSDELY